MSESFDPYHRWLGIPPKEQPPNHYRLLGLEPFESDREVIDSVAVRHIAFLQEITDGPHVKEAQRLLNELAAARRCLLDPEKKAAYDAQLRAAARAMVPPVTPSPRRRTARRSRRKPPPALWIVAGAVSVLLIAAVLAIRSTRPARDHGAPRGPVRPSRPVAALEGPTRPTAPRRTGRAEAKPSASTSDTRAVEPTAEKTAGGSSGAAKDPLSDSSEAEGADKALLPDLQKPAPATERVGESHPGDEAADGPAPARIAGLVLWLDAADASSVTLDEWGRLERWSDRSGNGNHASAEPDHAPALVRQTLGGRDVLRFDGSACIEVDGSSQLLRSGTGWTLISVARGQTGTLFSKGSGNSKGSFAVGDGVADLRASGRTLEAADRRPHAFRVRAISAESEGIQWFVDGQPSTRMPADGFIVTSRSRVRIGAFRVRGKGLAGWFAGELAELLVFNRPLNGAERQSVEAYLHEKWLGALLSPAISVSAEPSQEPSVEPAIGMAARLESRDGLERPTEPSGASEHEGDQPPQADQETPSRRRVALFVNLGGDGFEDPAGRKWVASRGFDGTTFGHEAGRAVKSGEGADPVAATAVRGIAAFRAIVPNGRYRVALFFSEHWTRDPTRRMFFVSVEGRVARFHAPGFARPYRHVFPNVTVKDGRLDVEFRPMASNCLAVLNGIAIEQIR